jgi:hypothetical protein
MVDNKKAGAKILVELTEEENKIVELYKTLHSMPTKKDAVKRIIREAKESLQREFKKI